MRILQVIEFFSPGMGGSAQVAYQTARHLARRGHDVTVWSSDFASDDGAFADTPFEIRLFPCRFSRWGLYLTPALAGWARRHIGEFDVIHLHNVRTFQNLVVASLARQRGIPYVLSAHGSLSLHGGRKATKRAYDVLLGRALLDGARRLIAVSPLEVDQYRQDGIPAERIVLVPNGLDLEEFSPLPPGGTFREGLGISAETQVILFLGRLHQIKGIDTLIEAFAQLRDEERDSMLIIAGPDDGDLARLQTLAGHWRLGDQVRFVGPLYGQDKLAAYVDADVLASPAVYEIFGLVPFEALMCGTPVVVSHDTGASQLIQGAGAGYLVPHDDVEALASTLLAMLGNRAEAQEKVAAGQAFVREELDWYAIAGRVEDLYMQVSGSVG